MHDVLHKTPAEAKTALVTGGSRGIGRGIAFRLAAEGYDVAISHWNDRDEAEQVRQRIEREYGRSCFVFHGDLAEASVPERLAEQAAEALGNIGVLVNNAGITIFNGIRMTDIDAIDRLTAIDFRAPLLLMKAAGSHMIERGIRGSIVNITSARGERAYAYDAVYGGVKAALARASQSIALEFSAYGIRVNCLAPGAIATVPERIERDWKQALRIPLERFGTPEDIGNAVAWLASGQSSYMTGTTLRIDGGLMLPGMPEAPGPAGDNGWRDGP